MKKLSVTILSALFVCLFAGAGSAQTDSLRDSTHLAVPAAPQDSATIRMARPDSAKGPHTILIPKTEKPKVVKKRAPRFSYFDTLATHFTSARLNQRRMLDQSWYHDAGDYFRFDPGFVVRDFQDTPMRKTVQPYGLAGDRLNVLQNDDPTHPFEHVVEPDGMFDMNDIPTAWDQDVFVLPGAAGMIFGGSGSIATLFTRPTRPQTVDPQSALLVDKGGLGFANTRGRFSKGFTNGRQMDLSIGYRRASTGLTYAGDDSYNYDGEVYWPTGEHQALTLTGHLYDRTGLFMVQPDIAQTGGLQFYSGYARQRKDRSARVGYEFQSAARPSRWEFGFNYLKQGSDLTGDYYGRFNQSGHGLYAQHDWQSERQIGRLDLSVDRLKYDDGRLNTSRDAAEAGLTLVRPFQSLKLGTRLGARWAESFGLMPRAALVAMKESNRALLLASVGFSQREPSPYERYLEYQTSSLYSIAYLYADSGNPSLKKESQLTGSLLLELGKPEQALRLEVTGGKILDGIDWVTQVSADSANRITFSPVNEDVSFATVTVGKDLALGSLFTFHGGYSYHYVDYAGDRNRPYQPDYNAFGGAELHYYWKQKLIHLWAYGEAVYVGPYDGYFETDLGQEVVFNAKLSFQMAHFRFYFLWQNPLDTQYRTRDYFTHFGRLTSFGFTWSFFD